MIKRLEKLTTEMARRKFFHSLEIKNSLLKSLINTKNNPCMNKLVYAKKKRRNSIQTGICKQRNLCLITGRAKGVIKLLGFSRQTLKRYALKNKVQNFRVAS